MKEKSDLQKFISWLQKEHLTTLIIYGLGIITILATLIRSGSFIYIPSGVFYQYTIYFIPILIIFIIIKLQKKPFLNYNEEGNKTWIYKKPLKFRKFIRLAINTVQVTLITILIYYFLGIFASFFPQNYSYYAYSTQISWKDISHSRRRHSQYYIGTYYTDSLIPNENKLVYTFASKFNRNYFQVKPSTYKDMYIDKKVTILSKTSFLWGEYIYDIDYNKTNRHYSNSTNRDRTIPANHIDLNTSKKHKILLDNQEIFDNKIHQKNSDYPTDKDTHHIVYPTLIKYEK